MAYPAGVVLRTVTAGHSIAAESGTDLVLTGRIIASRDLIRDGVRMPSSPESDVSIPGGVVSFSVPVSDQSGYRDLATGAIIDVSVPDSHTHTYTIKLVTTRDGRQVGPERTIGPFALPTDDLSPVDADTLITAETVPGLLVSVPDSWSASVAAAEAAALAAETDAAATAASELAAAASALAASGSATSASGSAAAASGSATAAQTAQTDAETAQGITVTARDAAIAARNTAAGSASDAAASAASAAATLANAAPATALYLPGVAGNNVSCPDSPGVSVAGDIDVRCRVYPADWTPTASATLASKYAAAGNRSWWFFHRSDASLGIFYSADGTAVAAATGAPMTGLVDGQGLWVRFTLDVDNGAGGTTTRFYRSDDGATWTQIGANIVNAGAVALFDSIAPIEIGSREGGTLSMFTGAVQICEIRSGIDGTVVARWDGRASHTRRRDPQGNIWTVNGTANAWEITA